MSSRTPVDRLWSAYAGLCLLCWLLYAVAATDWTQGSRTLWEGFYVATGNLGPAFLLGPALLPWARRLQNRAGLWRHGFVRALAHGAAALVFALAWQLLDFSVTATLFGAAHAFASVEQGLIWRSAWGIVIYGALMLGFGGVLLGRQAHRAELRAAQAEAERVRAELAAVAGKLNPHFLFNTLNTLLLLTRKDSAAAEQALLRFSRMLRHVLDGGGPQRRVRLGAELDFVRDYLALETLRLGERLRLDWQIEPGCEDEDVPPLTLQPLVENAVLHGIAPRVEGGRLSVHAARRGPQLHLRVSDDGPGCDWPPAPVAGRGIGLSALQRRFELDYEGQARFQVQTTPGQGFTVELSIPLTA